MIVGIRSLFAIESALTEAYESLSLRALGFFVIHVDSKIYGVRKPNASLLANSFEEVRERLSHRGGHIASYIDYSAQEIALAYRRAVYSDEPQASYVGMALSAFIDELHSNHIVWAPDGDEAFADGSYVLQFDKDEKVRLIAFKSTAGVDPDEGTVSDVWLSADDFYHCLDEWLNMFDAQWREAPKVTVL